MVPNYLLFRFTKSARKASSSKNNALKTTILETLETKLVSIFSNAYICAPVEINLKILHGAKELFMRYGIKSITMDDLANHLGMSKKTLYQAVDNKDELIVMILNQHQDHEQCTLEKLCGESQNAVEEMLKIGQHVTHMLRLVSPNTLYDLRKYHLSAYQKWELGQRNFIQERIRKNIERGQKEKYYREDLDIATISKLYVKFTFALTDVTDPEDSVFNHHHLFKQFIEYHLRSISTPAGIHIMQQFNYPEA